jgi:serine/threonine protein kinase
VASAGDRFGAYTLVRYQGSKPTGEVWSARSDAGLFVLVQVAPIEHRREEDMRARIARKLEAARSIDHANVVRVLDGGFVEHRAYIVTESIDGTDLARILKSAAREAAWPTPGVSGYVVHALARALAYAHARAVAHGDVAPRNIFIERSGAVKLSEFVGPLEAQELIKTAGQEQSGLLAYLSPELATSGRADPCGDVFALGAVLWELLAGRALFVRTTDLETLDAVKAADLPEMPPRIPAELGEIAKRCLARAPSERPSSEEVAERLGSAIARHPDASPSEARALAERGFRDRDRISDPPEPATPRSGPKQKTLLVDSDPTAIDPSIRRDAPTVPSNPPSHVLEEGSRADKTDEETPGAPAKASTDPFYDPRRDGVEWHGGRFEVLERLGSGGMGEVYRVRDRELDEVVALKIIPKESMLEMRSTERLKREVRLARKIASPYVCRIYDIVDLGAGLRGLTMSLVQGTTLSDLMRHGVAVDYKRFARWGADIAEGLDAAHRHSIIHRDLKPENVMIQADDRAVILDFGIALSSEASAAAGSMKLTQVGMIMGTPLYMSPEQIQNQPLDGRSDLFALGLILAELITSEVPMKAKSYAELLERRVTKATPFHLRNIDPGAPEELAQIIDQLLEIPPDRRPTTGMEIARRLRAFAEDGPKASAPPAASTPTAIDTGPPVPSPAEAHASARSRGAPRTLIALAVVALLLVALGIVLAESRRAREREETARARADGGVRVEEASIDAGAAIVEPLPADAGASSTSPKDAGAKRSQKLPPIWEP